MGRSVELRSPLVSIGTTFLHFDELQAHAFLGEGGSDEWIDGWYLDTSATHHMTVRREYFSDLDFTMRGFVKALSSSRMPPPWRLKVPALSSSSQRPGSIECSPVSTTS